MLHMGLAAGIHRKAGATEKSSLVFKDLGMTLQKCHLSLPCPESLEKSLETCYGIAEPNSHIAKAARQHLPTGKQWEIPNWKLSMEPQTILFMMLYLDIGLPLQLLLIFQAHYFNSVYIEPTINMTTNKLRSINLDTYLQF